MKGEYTQNVPLSVTYATSPAISFGDQGEEVACIGTSSVPELIATATQHGLVAVWNVSRQLKVCYRGSCKLNLKNTIELTIYQ